ncbi:MAG: hypothetical protein WAQ52_11900 [Terriglobales bacterium]
MKAARAVAVFSFLLVVPLGQKTLQAKRPATAESDVLLNTMEKELRRGQAELAAPPLTRSRE